jgi:hypothetical protein
MSTTTEQGYLTLVVQGRERPAALACDKCGRVYALGQEEYAAQCCEPYHCSTCGAETERCWTKCSRCRGEEEREKERARFEAATVVPWDEAAGAMLYDEEHDRWIRDIEDAEDDDPPTRYAYATRPRPLSIDADDTIDNALENGEHYEDAGMDVSGAEREELQTFLNGWCQRTGIVSYFPDHSRVVLFPAPTGATTEEG